MLDSIARALGRDALDVRRANFYGSSSNNVTPYGQTIDDNVIHEIVAELERTSDYRARRRQVDAFNATSPLLKKGLALTPVRVEYGSMSCVGVLTMLQTSEASAYWSLLWQFGHSPLM